jgi:hypothetical protein
MAHGVSQPRQALEQQGQVLHTFLPSLFLLALAPSPDKHLPGMGSTAAKQAEIRAFDGIYPSSAAVSASALCLAHPRAASTATEGNPMHAEPQQ